MLSCEQAKNLLSAYYDGELGVAAANEVAEHLESCGQCRKAYEDMLLLSSAFLSVDNPEIDEKFSASLSEKLAEVSKSMKPKGFGVWAVKMRPYIAAAACFVLVVGVYALVHSSQYLTNNVKPSHELLQLRTDETQKDISVKTEDVSPTPKADTKKEDIVAKANLARSNEMKNSKPASNDIASGESGENTQIQFSASNEFDESGLINGRAAADEQTNQKETNQPAQSEILVPLPSQTPFDEQGVLTDENTHSHGGGGGGSSAQTKAATAQFVLLDEMQIDILKDILYNYGICDIYENHIRLKVLSANYNACIEVLSGLEWLEASEIETNTDSEYCYIQINL